MSHVASVTNSYFDVSADGTADTAASTIDLSALTTFSDTNGWYGNLAATNGGDVIDPLLATTNSVNITVGASGASVPSQINTSQLTSISGGGISIYQPADLSGLTSLTNSGLYVTNGLVCSLPNLASSNGSSLTATNGAAVTLPAVTSLASMNGAVYLQASGAGSTLRFPALATIAGTSASVNFQALSGGQVLLPAVNTLIGSNVSFSSDGTGSLINLPSLTTTRC